MSIVNPNGNKFRRARMSLFLKVVEASRGNRSSKCINVLDLGGTVGYWRGMEDMWQGRDIKFTLVNLGAKPLRDGPFEIVDGNACDLSRWTDGSFDVVHSNSVIEHVGGWRQMEMMAMEVRRLAPSYFLQTPNYWFPVEPHYRSAFLHWLPEPLRVRMLMAKRRGFRGPFSSVGEARECIQSINLLTEADLRALFPAAKVWREKFLGLTKSLVAWQIGRTAPH